MNICLFSAEEIGKPLDLRDRRAEHIIKILHKKEGESFAAGVIGGMAGKAVIKAVRSKEEFTSDGKKSFTSGTLEYEFEPLTDGKPLYPLQMVIGFPRPIQLKRLLRDMAGLGVQKIHLVATELGEKSYLKSDLATSDSGYEMLKEGSEQAASTHLPALFFYNSLKECLGSLQKAADWKNNVKAALDNVGAEQSLNSFLNCKFSLQSEQRSPFEVTAAIGSERGWSQNERFLLEGAGFTRLSMGQRILRTETAATVAASLILGRMGYLE